MVLLSSDISLDQECQDLDLTELSGPGHLRSQQGQDDISEGPQC